MEPVIANSTSNKCINPVSSNCTTWNGPMTLGCIPVCSTDSVSDVIVKLAKTECYTQSLLDLTALDLSCIYTPCPSCQSPKKLIDILQIIVNAISSCCGCNKGTTETTRICCPPGQIFCPDKTATNGFGGYCGLPGCTGLTGDSPFICT